MEVASASKETLDSPTGLVEEPLPHEHPENAHQNQSTSSVSKAHAELASHKQTGDQRPPSAHHQTLNRG